MAQHLRGWIDYRGSDLGLYYWRTRSGVEVDFVVYGQEGIWGVEVKHTARVRPEDVRSLKNFSADYPGARTILLHRGRDRLKLGETWCIPVTEFLTALRPDVSLDEAAGTE